MPVDLFSSLQNFVGFLFIYRKKRGRNEWDVKNEQLSRSNYYCFFVFLFCDSHREHRDVFTAGKKKGIETLNLY